jgi:hypothetical protein
MSYPKSQGDRKTLNKQGKAPYIIRTAQTPAHCGFCGKNLEIYAEGMFFCDTKCSELWQRQMGSPDRIIPTKD